MKFLSSWFQQCPRVSIGFLALCLAGASGYRAEAADKSYSGFGSESVSREVIQSFAATPLDPELSRKIQSMLDVRTPGMGRVSPNGKSLYFSWNVTGNYQVWTVDGPQKFPSQLTGGEDRTLVSGISPDGKWLIVSRDRNGEENPGIYLQNPKGGALELVIHKKSVRAALQFISDDSKYIYFTSNEKDPSSFGIYRYEIKTKTTEEVFTETGLWSVADHQSGRLLLSKATGSLTSEYYEFDEKEKKLTPSLGVGEKEEYNASFGAHRGELLVVTPKFGEYRQLYKYKNQQFTPLLKEVKMDVSDFYVDHPHGRIYYTLNDGGYTRLRVMDARAFKSIDFPSFPKADHVYPGTTTHNGRFFTFGVESSQSPRMSYVYDWQTRKMTPWTLSSTPEVDTSQFAVAKLEHFKATDGTMVPMFVRRPAKCVSAETQCPVVVHFHGGPEAQSTPGFDRMAQLFVDEGFVYVEPNVRGSDGYGKTWLNSDNGPKRLEVITDIQDCANFIKANWTKNGVAPKVGVMGYSYGGYSTLFAMTKFSGTYDAGVALVGMSSLTSFLMNTAPYRRQLRITEYGDPEKDKEALAALSPLNFIEKAKDPLLIIQGASDPRVPVGEAIQMHNALRKKGVITQLILFADEGHGSQKRENQVSEIGHTINFFQNTFELREGLHGRTVSAPHI